MTTDQPDQSMITAGPDEPGVVPQIDQSGGDLRLGSAVSMMKRRDLPLDVVRHWEQVEDSYVDIHDTWRFGSVTGNEDLFCCMSRITSYLSAQHVVRALVVPLPLLPSHTNLHPPTLFHWTSSPAHLSLPIGPPHSALHIGPSPPPLQFPTPTPSISHPTPSISHPTPSISHPHPFNFPPHPFNFPPPPLQFPTPPLQFPTPPLQPPPLQFPTPTPSISHPHYS